MISGKPKIAANGDTLECEFDGCQIDGSLDEAVQFCLQLDEVKDLNPGSDYTEQYYNIQVTADSVTIIFNKEQLFG